MISQKLYVRVLVLFFLVWGLCACSSGVKPTEVDGTIALSSDTNPDHTGRPSPVIIRMYQLRNYGVFVSADFFTLYDNEASILSGDLISREEYNLMPGEAKSISVLMDPQTQYVGVIAAFRDIEHSTWRAVSTLPEKSFYDFSSPVIEISLGRKAISVKVK